MEALNVVLIPMSIAISAMQSYPTNDPNIAAAAFKRESREEVVVQLSVPPDTPAANYKIQIPNIQQTGRVTLFYTPAKNLSNINYKTQHTNYWKSTESTNGYPVKK